MYKRYNSVYSVIDTEQEQHNYPLPLWGLTAVELWEKNNGNKYGKIEFYRFVNYFPIEEFKTKFYNQFKIYIKTYPDGTIETFKKREYQQFIYECGDMIELINKEDWIYWSTEGEFDFYIQGKKHSEQAYILDKDPHIYLTNLTVILNFINNATAESNKKGISKTLKYSFSSTLNKHQIEYLYTNYFSIYFDCTLKDIDNLFSENINTKITLNKKGVKKVDIIYFFSELKNNGLIRSTTWQDAIVKTECIIIQNKPLASGQITTSKNIIRNSYYNETVKEFVENVILDMPK